ncbi:FkbM family methyltransferase [Hyphomonas sp. UBA4494]|jgi:FkbM family methyltransferase|uniref:FkbM family methyltransferase n=1 Tax=Hyphomonas sp. UBA4494 TaxID=1946631 RepID=UPI0025C49004|nr:FkbM family methyltransferase [Hyphomonas sp. UBA4494]
MKRLISTLCRLLLKSSRFRQLLLAEVKRTTSAEEKSDLLSAFVDDSPELLDGVASRPSMRDRFLALPWIRERLGRDVEFLINSVSADKNRNAFFADGRIRTIASKQSGIRDKFGKDVRFLVQSALSAENRKAFFGNGEIQAAATATTSIRRTLGNDVRFLTEFALSEENQKTFFGKEEVQAAATATTSIRSALGNDLRFLTEYALSKDNQKAFFGNGEVQAAAIATTSIRNALGNDLRFLTEYALNNDNQKAFFGNGEVQAAAIATTSIRRTLGNDVRFLTEFALSEENRKTFFGKEEVQAAAIATTSIRNALGNDLRFLIEYTLSETNRKTFFGNGEVQAAIGELSSVRNSILTSQLNEREAVGVLSGTWPMKQRQLDGFSKYLDMISRLKVYYGDSPVLKDLETASIPDGGFPNDIVLRDFFTEHLCRGQEFLMRDSTLTYVDKHAIWTLIHEILMDQEYYFDTDQKKPYIIDAGANFGMSSVYFKELYPNAEVLAFEPVPFLHDLASKNVARNKLSDVTVLKKGLAAKPGTATFFMSGDYSMAGSLTERRRTFGDEIEELTIETVPLADYLNREVDFLKLDIEGAEGEVLMAAGDALANVRQMCVEWHLGANPSDIALDDVLSILTRLGFRYQIGKSGNYAKRSRSKPMSHLGELGTLNFWAKRDT